MLGRAGGCSSMVGRASQALNVGSIPSPAPNLSRKVLGSFVFLNPKKKQRSPSVFWFEPLRRPDRFRLAPQVVSLHLGG